MSSSATATADSTGVTNRQPQYVAPTTWGGTSDSPTSESQSAPSASVGSTADVSGLSDAQIAAVLQAINQGEIKQGVLASNHASAASVKRFASHMVTAHRTMLATQTAILSRAQITPSANAVSNQLKRDGRAQLSTLQSMRGRDFDRAYVDAQVRGHSEALDIIDRTLPTLRNPELKMDVQNARPRVEAHLREAQRLQQQLQTGSASAQPSIPGGGAPIAGPSSGAASDTDMDAGM
jgi:putative membrane protein